MQVHKVTVLHAFSDAFLQFRPFLVDGAKQGLVAHAYVVENLVGEAHLLLRGKGSDMAVHKRGQNGGLFRADRYDIAFLQEDAERDGRVSAPFVADLGGRDVDKNQGIIVFETDSGTLLIIESGPDIGDVHLEAVSNVFGFRLGRVRQANPAALFGLVDTPDQRIICHEKIQHKNASVFPHKSDADTRRRIPSGKLQSIRNAYYLQFVRQKATGE